MLKRIILGLAVVGSVFGFANTVKANPYNYTNVYKPTNVTIMGHDGVQLRNDDLLNVDGYTYVRFTSFYMDLLKMNGQEWKYKVNYTHTNGYHIIRLDNGSGYSKTDSIQIYSRMGTYMQQTSKSAILYNNVTYVRLRDFYTEFCTMNSSTQFVNPDIRFLDEGGKMTIALNTWIVKSIALHNISMEYPLQYDNGASITIPKLRQLFDYIRDNGYTPVFYSDLLNNGYLKYNKPILITLDDGYASNYRLLFPMLKEYNFKANIALIGSKMYTGSGFNQSTAGITKNQMLEMQNSGLVAFGCHSYDLHRTDFDKLPVSTVIADLQKWMQEYNFLPTPQFYAYPYTLMTPDIDNAIRAFGIPFTSGAHKSNITIGYSNVQRVSIMENSNLAQVIK